MQDKLPTIEAPAQPAPLHPAEPRPRKIPWLCLLLVASLVAIYSPALISNMRHAVDPLVFNDDARQQIWPFLRYADAQLFRRDVIADYYLACMPSAYKVLYASTAKWVDPIKLSKILPYVLLVLTTLLCARAAGLLQGAWAAWATAALCLGSPVFLQRMGGGLPRGLAFPLYAGAALALIGGRPILLGAITVAAAALYPPAVPITCGLALAGMLLVLPARQRGAAAGWGVAKRLALVGGTAVVAALLVLPIQRASSDYGRIIRPSDAAEFPEAGPGGRYTEQDRVPSFRSDLAELIRAPLSGLGGNADGSLVSHGRLRRTIPLWLFAAFGAVGAATLLVRDTRIRRLLLLAGAALLAHVVSIPLCPYLYLPERYLAYPLPIVAAILIPVGIAALPLRFARASYSHSARGPTVLAICGSYLVFLFVTNGRSVKTAGLDRNASAHRTTYEFIDQTRTSTMIAGFPSDVDDIPYVCRRSVLVSRETHQAFHSGYAMRMRGRADAVIDALYAPDRTGLERLRDEFGVDYLIVSSKLYDPTPPRYFAPFDDRIARARKALGGLPADVQHEKNLLVLTDGDWSVLDLGLLPVRIEHPTSRPGTRAGVPGR